MFHANQYDTNMQFLNFEKPLDTKRASHAQKDKLKKVKISFEIPDVENPDFSEVTNPEGICIKTINDSQINFRLGFQSIADYLSYVNNRTMMGLSQICSVNNQMSKKYVDFISLSEELYKNKINVESVDLTLLFKLLVSEGFVLVEREKNLLISYIKFGLNNIPEMVVNINNSNEGPLTTSYIYSGKVTRELFVKIESILIPYLQEEQTKYKLYNLKNIEPQRENGRVVSTAEKVKLTDEMDYSLQEFYPWINIKLIDYFEEFMSSRSNVLILIGPPGTGKSTMIRTMIKKLGLSCLVSYKPEVIMSPFFIEVCQGFLSSEHNDASDNLRKAVIVEDADLLMSKRSEGNHRMSEVLNATSGIATDTESKFILSTNLKDVDDIDPALMRPGRCFDILCFRDLTAAEATTIRLVRGLEPREFNPNGKYKLAEVLNDAITQQKVDPIIKPRFGFN